MLQIIRSAFQLYKILQKARSRQCDHLSISFRYCEVFHRTCAENRTSARAKLRIAPSLQSLRCLLAALVILLRYYICSSSCSLYDQRFVEGCIVIKDTEDRARVIMPSVCFVHQLDCPYACKIMLASNCIPITTWRSLCLNVDGWDELANIGLEHFTQ